MKSTLVVLFLFQSNLIGDYFGPCHCSVSLITDTPILSQVYRITCCTVSYSLWPQLGVRIGSRRMPLPKEWVF